MKLTYIYDLKMMYDGVDYYSKNFTNQTWWQYQKVAKHITIYPIVQPYQSSTNLLPIHIPELHIQPLEHIEQTKDVYKKWWSTVAHCKEIIANSEAIVIRLPSHFGLAMGQACLQMNKPYLVEVVGNALEAYRWHGNKGYRLLASFIDKRMKKIIANAYTAIYVTENYLQAVYPSNGQAFTVYNTNLSKQLPIKRTTTFNIGMIGSLHTKYKGHYDLFHALRILDQQQIPITVYLLGEGKLPPLTYQYITVIHEGIIDRTLMDQWYRKLQLYVQPSHTEALGRSIMEAMSHGLPVVATQVGGIPELLDHTALVKKQSPQQLATKIQALLHNEQLWQQHAKRNYTFVQRFNMTTNTVKRQQAFAHYYTALT
ncbi:hypothetical protein GCM10007425_05940 [Lysinibacillus alkalisoli]|uniref:Glycosyltransferase family 4 protein n=1 Tax=Lysinibacillus alkalisoli TaxID=1911548 RepID=A0A917LD52_9BACI|nr:glycosyltransferase [Lysinibacillus alkalisoli]GGG14472.1 hypothetical protein GCM10007425_05940 [Lysinibacillus alkalisoli]